MIKDLMTLLTDHGWAALIFILLCYLILNGEIAFKYPRASKTPNQREG